MSIDDGSPISELVVILTAVNDILVSLCIFLGREMDSGGRPERLVEGIIFGSCRNTTGLR
jgi:hypothetical protein